MSALYYIVASNGVAEQTPATIFQVMYNALRPETTSPDLIKPVRIEDDNVSAIKLASRSNRQKN